MSPREPALNRFGKSGVLCVFFSLLKKPSAKSVVVCVACVLFAPLKKSLNTQAKRQVWSNGRWNQLHLTFRGQCVTRATLAQEAAVVVDAILLTPVRPVHTLVDVITADAITVESVTVAAVTSVGAWQVDAQHGAVVLLRTLVDVNTPVRTRQLASLFNLILTSRQPRNNGYLRTNHTFKNHFTPLHNANHIITSLSDSLLQRQNPTITLSMHNNTYLCTYYIA